MTMRLIRTSLALCAVPMLLLNLYGTFTSLRHENVADLGVSLSYRDVMRQVAKRPDESSESYVIRLNGLVHRGTAHYWQTKEPFKYNVRLPVWENYLLYAGGLVRPDIFGGAYELANHRKALERGVGLCSQRTIILVGLLSDQGITAHPVGLEGHVVARVAVGDKWYIADPDYGVVLPYDLPELESDPMLVRQYYSAIDDVETVVQVFAPEGNTIWPPGVRGMYAYHPNAMKVYYVERLSYVGIWVLPALLLLPWAWQTLRRRGGR